MCRRHWGLVPRSLQRAVWDAYRPGQCDDKRPSEAWHRAADAAIRYMEFLLAIDQLDGRRGPKIDKAVTGVCSKCGGLTAVWMHVYMRCLRCGNRTDR